MPQLPLAFLLFCICHVTLGTTPLQLKTTMEQELLSDVSDPIEHRVASDVPSPRFRLPLTVIPSEYYIKMRPVLDPTQGLEQFTAPSEVTILVTCSEVTNVVTLHQRNLTIDHDRVVVTHLGSGTRLSISSQDYDVEKDFYHIHLNEDLIMNEEYAIFIPFVTPMSLTENVGLYRAHYTDPESKEIRYMSTTKFEPYHARKAFPLFDEPDLKAKFKITLGRTGSYHSLSNMPLFRTIRDNELPGWYWDEYELTTVKMPAYLVCMIVSDFENATSSAHETVPVASWAPRHYIEKRGGDFAAVKTSEMLTYFEKTFKMSYALPKLDTISPPQFASGAMENWGLITYRQEFMLYFPGDSTESERRKIAQVLGHEVSHQWFGNVVTCKWWSEIWLNEGFARFLQFWAMRETIPELEPMKAYVNDVTQLAMVFDQGPNTHPVKNTALRPTEQSAVFDRISYEKGAALMQMMESFITPPLFLQGLILYLNNMQYAGAEQNDLFSALNEKAQGQLPPGASVQEIMDTWTLQAGYPIVRVHKGPSNSTIFISQEKHGLDIRHPLKGDDDNSLWWIPIKIISADEPSTEDRKPTLWLPKNVSITTYSRNIDASKWIVFNPDAIGYYRVLYDPPLTHLILEQLESDPNVFTPATRSQFIDDYFNLAFSGYVNIETALEFTKYLHTESQFPVWNAVINNLKDTYTRFTGSGAFQALKTYLLPRIEGGLTFTGPEQLPSENGSRVILRAHLLDFACGMGHTQCVDYSKRLVNDWFSTPDPETNKVPADVQAVAYCTAVRVGDTSVWTRILDEYERSWFWSHTTKLLNAEACSDDEEVLRQTMEIAWSSSKVKESDRLVLMQAVAANSKGRQLAFDFMKGRLGQPNGPDRFAGVVSTLSTYWNEESHMEEIKTVIRDNEDALRPVLSSLNNSINKISANILWWNKFGYPMEKWFKANV